MALDDIKSPDVLSEGPEYAVVINTALNATHDEFVGVEDGSKINDEAIKERHLDITNSASDGAMLLWQGGTEGSFEWETELTVPHLPIDNTESAGANDLVTFMPGGTEGADRLVVIDIIPAEKLPEIPLDKLPDIPTDKLSGQIASDSLEISGTPAQGYIIKVKADGGLEYNPGAAINDTGAIRMNESDDMGYIDDKTGDLAAALWL